MRKENKVIYIVGGTNGVGKSSWYKKIIKDGVPYINADFVAKELAGGKVPGERQYELAQAFCTAQINNLISAERSFAFENNMHEESNYQMLKHLKEDEGYQIMFYYLGVENLDITTDRIQQRMKNGDHYVPADQVSERFERGMKLLEKYYKLPDQLTLIDTTRNPFMCYQLKKGQKIFQTESLPDWVSRFAATIEKENALLQELEKNNAEAKQSNKDTFSKKPKNQNKLQDKLKLVEKKGRGKQRGFRP